MRFSLISIDLHSYAARDVRRTLHMPSAQAFLELILLSSRPLSVVMAASMHQERHKQTPCILRSESKSLPRNKNKETLLATD